MLIDGTEGFRAAAGAPAALAGAIETHLDNPLLVSKLTCSARNRLGRYELSTMVRCFDRLRRAIGNQPDLS